MKSLLVTTSYPRSGNTFLNYALNNLYYPNQDVNQNFHTAVALSQFDKILVSVRNPLDCISSWHHYPSGHGLEDDIKYYLRFFNAALEAKSAVFADFERFTVDVDYIKELVGSNFDTIQPREVSIDDIKASMRPRNQLRHLPNNDRTEAINRIKEDLINMPRFAECVDLYETVKSKL